MNSLAMALRVRGSFTREVAATLLGSLGVRLVGMALGFLVGIQLARYLGVEEYGVYGYVMAVATLAGTVSLFGLQLLAVRETSFACEREDWAGLSGFLRWAWRRALAFALLMAGAVMAWLSVAGPASAMPLPIWGALFVPVAAAVALAGPMIRGLGQIVRGQMLDTLLVPGIQCLLLAGAMLMLGRLDAGRAMALGLAATFVAALVAVWWLVRAVPAAARAARPRSDGAQWHRAMLPMGATTVMRALDAQLPVLVLGLLVAAQDLGLFRVALASMLLVSFPYTLVSIAAPPLAARLVAAGDGRRLQRLASGMSIGTLLPTLAIMLLLDLAGVPLIRLLFGPGYVGAWPVLMVLAAAGVATAFFGVTPAILFATGHERLVTLAFLAGLMMLALFLAVLVPAHGIVGGAWAIVAGVVTRELLLWRFCCRASGIDPSPWRAAVELRRS